VALEDVMKARVALLACLLLGCGASEALASWGLLPLRELVPKSDVGVVGQLVAVREWTDDGIDHGEGTIEVESVIFGDAPESRLHLTWRNRSELACPRVEHGRHQNVRSLWLLTRDTDTDAVQANHPSRTVSLESDPDLDSDPDLFLCFELADSEQVKDPRFDKIRARFGERKRSAAPGPEDLRYEAVRALVWSTKCEALSPSNNEAMDLRPKDASHP
jgi:hypothetical protein